MNGRRKISFVGAGNIGGAMAQVAFERELADIVLLDKFENIARGKALDIAEAAGIVGSDVQITGTGDYSHIKDSDVIIVTAGIARKPGMSRDDLLGVNAGIVKEVAENIKKYAPNSIIIVVSNPMDAMVTLMQKYTGFPYERVIGQGGVLDTSRFQTFIAWELGLSVKNINAPVLGGHGDAMVPMISYANVNGVPVMELLEQKYGSAAKAREVMDAMVKRTAFAGGEVVEILGTGSAFYSPAVASLQMAEAIMKDEKRVLASCAYCTKEYNANGYYIGVPAILGKKGIEGIIEVKLSDEETKMMQKSIESCKSNVDALKALNLI